MIFVDTSFWVAYRNRADAHHADALTLMATHADSGLFTSNHVRGETWTFLRRRVGHHGASSFLDAIDQSPRITLVFVERPLEDEASEWLRRHDEREYSFVDATSFAVMRERRMTDALAFDGDFSAAGFVELRSR